jgi:hypothetical protein
MHAFVDALEANTWCVDPTVSAAESEGTSLPDGKQNGTHAIGKQNRRLLPISNVLQRDDPMEQEAKSDPSDDNLETLVLDSQCKDTRSCQQNSLHCCMVFGVGVSLDDAQRRLRTRRTQLLRDTARCLATERATGAKVCSLDNSPSFMSRPSRHIEMDLNKIDLNQGLRLFTKPAAVKRQKLLLLLRDAFFSQFKSKHTNAREVVVRNRFMLSIGKAWLRVVLKHGIWIPKTFLPTISVKPSKLDHCMFETTKHSVVGKVGSRGTNLPQVAAFVCHLLDSGMFTLDGRHKLYDATQHAKNGAYDSGSPPPADWDVFSPHFRLAGEKLRGRGHRVLLPHRGHC